MWGNIGYRHSAYLRFIDIMGYTAADHNPDSWEGWHWGGMHTCGFSWRLGAPEQYDLLEDALENTEMIVFWSADPETNGGIYAAHESHVRRHWLKELGIKMVFIDPFYNHTAGVIARQVVLPRADSAPTMRSRRHRLHLDYRGPLRQGIHRLRTLGFDKWKDYILGKEDGVPKTSEWAEKETTIPASEIRALAREWGQRRPCWPPAGSAAGAAPAGPRTAPNGPRLMVCLAAMQGMGKPGSNIWSTTQGAR